jgi:hypothetical protein
MRNRLARTVARTTAVVAAAVGLAIAVPAVAQAKDKLDLGVSGYAVPTAPTGGAYAFSGWTSAVDDTFYGTTFSGTFGPVDSTLPQRAPAKERSAP